MTTPTPLRIKPLAEARRREIERRARLKRLASLTAGDDLAWRLARAEGRVADRSATPADLPPGPGRELLRSITDGKTQRRNVGGAVVASW